MHEILDEEEVLKGKEVIDKRVTNPLKVAIIYLATIFFGTFTFVFIIYLFDTLSKSSILNRCIEYSIMSVVIFLVTSLFVETLKLINRKFISTKYKNTILHLNPFWFQVIEGSFGMAIIVLAFILLIILIKFTF